MTTTPEVTNPLLRELLRIHDLLRRDLRACGALADATLAGAPTAWPPPSPSCPPIFSNTSTARRKRSRPFC